MIGCIIGSLVLLLLLACQREPDFLAMEDITGRGGRVISIPFFFFFYSTTTTTSCFFLFLFSIFSFVLLVVVCPDCVIIQAALRLSGFSPLLFFIRQEPTSRRRRRWRRREKTKTENTKCRRRRGSRKRFISTARKTFKFLFKLPASSQPCN